MYADETLVNHINGEQVWAFGLYELERDRIKVFIVPNRSAQVLQPIIRENVSDETNFYSDMWRGYLGLHNNFNPSFTHTAINHSMTWGHGLESTNYIESQWAWIKLKLRSVYHTFPRESRTVH